jgi:hypothetical protein
MCCGSRANYLGAHLVYVARFFRNDTDKPYALTWKRLYQALCFTGIADAAAGRIDSGGKRGFRNDSTTPDSGDQIVPAYDALALADQVAQDVEDLGLHWNKRASTAQFAPIGIKTITFELIAQRRASQ